MVSMSKSQTADKAFGYYAKENYYQKNSEIGLFYGEGLKHFGIEQGAVITKKAYKNLLNGMHPETGKPLVKGAGNEDRRAGFDVTFSAPKSVSILMESADANGYSEVSKKLREAHKNAVLKAMEKIQNDYAKTRIYNAEGERVRVKTEIIFANFEHDTSRAVNDEIDPQLHDHNFIFSMSKYEDPVTGVVKNMALSNEEIYKNKMFLGQTYRSEFAKNLSDIGYQIEVSNVQNGFFEIKGFTENQLDEFSSRSKKMRTHLPKFREKFPTLNEAELLEKISEKLKTAKKKIDREKLLERNNDRLKSFGIDKDFLNNFHKIHEEKQPQATEKIIQNHLNKVTKTLTDRQSVFSKEEFLVEALKYGLEHRLVEKDYLDAMAKDPNVVKLDDNVFTTQKMIDAELNIIDSINLGKNSQKPYQADTLKIDEYIAENYVGDRAMTDGQIQMCRDILTSTDQIIAIQGDAGTGKTFSARAIREFMQIQNPNLKIEGIVYTGRATSGLETDSGIKSTTIHKYLGSQKIQSLNPDKRDRLIIVDESGMVGSVQVADIIKTLKPNDKVVFMGDTKQFKSISAGCAFLDMQKYGVKTTFLNEVKRQDEGYTIEAVANIKQNQIEEALDKIAKNGLFEEIERDEMIAKVTDKYVNLNAKNRDETLILSSTNKDRRDTNNAIREGLKMGGAEYTIRENLSFTGTKSHYNTHYEEGLFIAIQDGKIDGFQNGQQLIVVGKKEGSDKIILVTPIGGGKPRELNVFENGDNLQVYREVQKQFCQGDRITFTKNTTLDKKTRMEVKNGDRDYIKKIYKNGDFITQNGKKFNIKEMNYIDHGYVVTDVKSQGATAKSVMIMANSQMANYNSFYTQVTRAKSKIEIFTDNKEQLLANIQKSNKEKSTLDFLLNPDGTRKEIKNTKIQGEENGRDIKQIEPNGREPIEQNGRDVVKNQRNREVADTSAQPHDKLVKGEQGDTSIAQGAHTRANSRTRITEQSIKRTFGKIALSDRETIEQLIIKIDEAIVRIEAKIKDILEKEPMQKKIERETNQKIKKKIVEKTEKIVEKKPKKEQKNEAVESVQEKNKRKREEAKRAKEEAQSQDKSQGR